MTSGDRIRELDSKLESRELVTTRVYLHDPAHCSSIDDDKLFELRVLAAKRLNVPIRSIALAGSGQTGWSIKRSAPFDPKVSDLDFAVVDTMVFANCLSDVVSTCRGYTDMTAFRDIATAATFRDYASKGILIPRFFPRSPLRSEWEQIATELTASCLALGKYASFAIYINEQAFIGKQRSAIRLIGESR